MDRVSFGKLVSKPVCGLTISRNEKNNSWLGNLMLYILIVFLSIFPISNGNEMATNLNLIKIF